MAAAAHAQENTGRRKITKSHVLLAYLQPCSIAHAGNTKSKHRIGVGIWLAVGQHYTQHNGDIYFLADHETTELSGAGSKVIIVFVPI